jgi:hypothetical protein
MKIAQYTKSLTVALREEAYDQIKEITNESQISMADWVREAIASALLKFKPKEDTMR